VARVEVQEVDVKRTFTTCSSPTCPDYFKDRNPPNGVRYRVCSNGAKFCPTCGAETKQEEVVTGKAGKTNVEWSDVQSYFEQEGLDECGPLHFITELEEESGCHFVIVNGSKDDYGALQGDKGFGNVHIPSEFDTDKILAEFATEWPEYVAAMKHLYGHANVSVEWIFMNYWS
jgi:hypothetical protein